jgi:hypothetical protein
MSNRLTAARRALKAVKPLSLCEYLAAVGGLRLFRSHGATVGSSDLLRMDADRWHRQKPFRPKLVRDDSGHTPDDACEIAWEAGYFPTHETRPDINDLLDLIREDLATGSVYSEFDYEELERIAIQELSDIDADAVQTNDAARMAPLRVIPLNSVPVRGISGDVVYLYEIPFMTKKGIVGTTYYAKAFCSGERRHDWHHAFRTARQRDDAVNAWFAENAE